MTFILARPSTSAIWPFDPLRLKEFYPSTIFGDNMSDDNRADFYCFPVVAAEEPEYDNLTEALTAVFPVLIDGEWVQGWTVGVRPEPPAPEPDYDLLYNLLLVSPAYNGFIVRASDPETSTPAMLVAQSALTDALREARTRAPIIPAIQAALNMVLAAGAFTEPELTSLQEILVAAHLDEIYSLE